jgi:flavin reductase ActVB
MSSPVEPAAFRAVMARWPTGVSVVTGHEDGHDVGLTVNAFLSVSLTPPTVLVSLSLDADSTAVVDRTGRFTVNLLAASQRDVSERFARTIPSGEKFGELPIERGAGSVPRLRDALAALECEVRSRLQVADHRVFVGEVIALHPGPDAPPLVFYHSGYAEVEQDGRYRLVPPR